MHILSAELISKSYSEKSLFQGVSFGIDSRDKIGLIGSNGAGKSTLAAIVAGMETPDSGSISTAAGASTHFLPQNPSFAEDSTVLREVFRGDTPALQALYTYHGFVQQVKDEPGIDLNEEMVRLNLRLDNLGAWELEAGGRAILSRLGITDLMRRPSSLSGGELKRVALARALITSCQLLILDEPTNHLDSQAVLWLEDHLQRRTGALLLITHDRWLLSRVTNRIFEVDRGEFLDCRGGYPKYLELKAERAEAEQAAVRKHRAALKRELTWVLQGAKARSTKEKTRKQKYEELKEQVFKAQKAKVEVDIPAQRLGKKVIELKDVVKTQGDQTLLKHFNCTILPRDRMGIVGPNGSGKTTLLDIIAGLSVPDSGRVERGKTVKIGYYRQQAEELDDNLRVIQYIEGIRLAVKTASGGTITAAKMLERFLFEGSAQWTYIRDLSGGERRRLYLLGILMDEPNVLLLDEPTNDLDIETLTVLEDYLEDFPGAVLAVSHDRWFLDKSTRRLLALDGNGHVKSYVCSFSDYLAENNQVRDPAPEKESTRPRRKKTKLNYKEQREFNELEKEIDILQNKLEERQSLLQQGGDDYQRLNELHQQVQELEGDLEQKMERWLELQELKEQYKQE